MATLEDRKDEIRTISLPLLAIDTARGCAWRAFYVSVRSSHDGTRAAEFSRQVFHLGIDPTSSRASIFGGFSPTLRRFWSFRVYLPFMVPRYGEDPNPKRGGGKGQAPRARSVTRPMPTIVPSQNGAQLVAAFLAKHNGGHEATGQHLFRGMDTIVARENKALVASSLVKLKGTCAHGQQLHLPLATVQAGGLHYAETRAYLVKYYGSNDAARLDGGMPTATSLDRLGLVTVHGEQYVVADIGMRMLCARELYNAQGFPDDYLIDVEVDGKRLTNKAQVRMVGNSVCPPVAAALALAQFQEHVIEVRA